MAQDTRLGAPDLPALASLALLGGLALGATALTVIRATGGQGGVPLDDAWIHFQFARNLAAGQGVSFNPGQPTSGTTAPLWTLLLAGIAWLGGPFPVSGQVLSGLCYLATIGVTYRLGWQVTGRRLLAWAAAASVAVSGRMAWAAFSALETCLFAGLSMLALGAFLRDQRERRFRVGTGLLLGLAALARPEGYLLAALALADFSFATLVDRTAAPRERWRRLPWLPALIFGALVAPYLVFSWSTSGHLLPNTFHAKAVASPWPDRDFLGVAARYLILDTTLLLPLCVLGALMALRRARLLSLWALGLPLAYAFLHVPLYQHGRYLMPLIPCQGLLVAIGLAELPGALPRRWRRLHIPRTAAAPLLVLLTLAATGWRFPTMARLTAANVANINQMHVALGRWVAENTPPDALLALNDIGAIAYISQRPVLDLAGLVSPEVTPLLLRPDRDERLAELIVEREVQFVIIFPLWFPGLAARTDLLEPLTSVTLTPNTVAGSDTMVVYRTRWAR
jgi:arabinofuranosyltransferase